MIAVRPDRVLTSTFLQESLVEALRSRGVSVCHTDPRTLANVLESFVTNANALGIPALGNELQMRVMSELKQRAPPGVPLGFSSKIRRGAPSAEHRPLKVYAEEWHAPPMASGNWVPDLIALAGGESFLPSGERSRVVALEEVAAFDPDVIVLNYCGMSNVSATAQTELLRTRVGWNTLRAVRARRIAPVDDSLLNRPGPRLSRGMEQIAHAITAVRANTHADTLLSQSSESPATR